MFRYAGHDLASYPTNPSYLQRIMYLSIVRTRLLYKYPPFFGFVLNRQDGICIKPITADAKQKSQESHKLHEAHNVIGVLKAARP